MNGQVEFASNGNFKNLLNLTEFTPEFTYSLFKQAEQFLQDGFGISSKPLLKHKSVATLFFEASTRTRASFELAAKKLGADVINLQVDFSSAKKGETVIDTIANLAAMSIEYFIIRHSEDNLPMELAEHFAEASISIINAGDGKTAHPSQALLDVFTMYRHQKDLQQAKIVIVGDVLHSRVARSNIQLLNLLGAKNIQVVAPPQLLPSENFANTVMTSNVDEALVDADVVMVLRLQKERMQETLLTSFDDYHEQYGITEQRLIQAKPDVIVMHPGPMNRGVEIAASVADGEHAVILQQVHHGVAIRMAVLAMLRH